MLTLAERLRANAHALRFLLETQHTIRKRDLRALADDMIREAEAADSLQQAEAALREVRP